MGVRPAIGELGTNRRLRCLLPTVAERKNRISCYMKYKAIIAKNPQSPYYFRLSAAKPR